MSRRFKPIRIRTIIAVLLGLVVLTGAVVATRAPHPATVARTPQPTHLQVPSPSPASSPVVAGAATQATSRVATPRSLTPTLVPAAATPVPTPSPVSDTATLNLSYQQHAFSYRVSLAGVSNACNILTAAHAQGLISSVTLKDFPALGSQYVYEINGLANNWTYSATDSHGQALSPLGCSQATPIEAGAVINWKY